MSGLVSRKLQARLTIGCLERSVAWRVLGSISDILLVVPLFPVTIAWEDTPVPISNTAVKLHSGDMVHGGDRPWESSSRRRELFGKSGSADEGGSAFFCPQIPQISADYRRGIRTREGGRGEGGNRGNRGNRDKRDKRGKRACLSSECAPNSLLVSSRLPSSLSPSRTLRLLHPFPLAIQAWI